MQKAGVEDGPRARLPHQFGHIGRTFGAMFNAVAVAAVARAEAGDRAGAGAGKGRRVQQGQRRRDDGVPFYGVHGDGVARPVRRPHQFRQCRRVRMQTPADAVSIILACPRRSIPPHAVSP